MSRAQEYRLRSFEAAYVKPHLEFFEEHGGRSWLEDQSNLEFPSGWSEGLLRLSLLREASNWIRMGRQSGYFSPDIEPLSSGWISLPAPGAPRETGFWPLDPERRYLLWSQDWLVVAKGESFEEELTLAMEDLTDDRLEFLRLFFFTEEMEWQQRMEYLGLIVEAAEEHRVPIRAEFMEPVTWVLQGPVTTMQEFRGFPADWRVQQVLSNLEAPRAEKLENYRTSISRAVTSQIQRGLPDGVVGAQEAAELFTAVAEQERTFYRTGKPQVREEKESRSKDSDTLGADRAEERIIGARTEESKKKARKKKENGTETERGL